MSYRVENGSTYRVDDDGESELLANFIAEITKEVRFVNGIDTQTVLTIKGWQLARSKVIDTQPGQVVEELEPLDSVEVSAEAFAAMSWVMPAWGVRAVIRPGSGIKDDLRAAIQLRSNPEVSIVYRHMGWTKLGDGRTAYLHAGGAMTAKGNDPNVVVNLPHELSNYDLSTTVSPKDGAAAILDLSNLTNKEVMWPLIGGCLAPLYGPVDFAEHLTGRTGTFKSEVMSLLQSFYGPKMDARHLPGSWSSTGNALEAQAFLCCNAAFVIDDFVPAGTSWQVRAYQQNADKIMRAQGNQSGRARLTDASNLQRTMYPRGIVLSTGEDTPEGHSVRARMMIMELSPGDVSPNVLSSAQAQRPKFVGGVAGLVQELAARPPDLQKRMDELRRENVTIGHARTPSMIARLVAVLEHFITWAGNVKAIDKKEVPELISEAREAIVAAGNRQTSYLEDSDPVDIFLGALRQVLANGNGHIRTLNNGIPQKAETLGWMKDDSGEFPVYKAKGPTIGWIKWNDDELLLEMNVGFAAVKKAAGNDMSLTKQTLFRRLKDAGALARTDDTRQRNTVRITADNHPRHVVALLASRALQTQEGADDDESDGNEIPE